MTRVVKGLFIGVAGLALVVGVGVSASQATELDLSGGGQCLFGAQGGTTGTATCSNLGGGYWSLTPSGATGAGLFSVTNTTTGSGYINSFLRIGPAAGPGSDVVDGMNTDGAFQNDEQSHTFTRSVATSDLQSVTIDGTDYYKFLLDINQQGSDPLLTLSGLQLCTSKSSTWSLADTCSSDGAGGANVSTLKWDLDGVLTGAGTANNTSDALAPVNTVLMDYNKNSGSGSGDLFFYIPVKTLIGANGTIDSGEQYLYLWSQFGRPTDIGNNNDGYEEWAYLGMSQGVPFETVPFETLTHPPEPGSLILLGSGLLLGGSVLRKRALAGKISKAAK